jgi:hypothetical protein
MEQPMASKRRKKVIAWASCGSNGRPFVTIVNRLSPENVGRLQIFDTQKRAADEGGYTRRVTIYIDAEPPKESP